MKRIREGKPNPVVQRSCRVKKSQVSNRAQFFLVRYPSDNAQGDKVALIQALIERGIYETEEKISMTAARLVDAFSAS
jgi:hypothetical protein